MLAVETEFPNTYIAGCYFHFTQLLWWHLQDLGLARALRGDEQFRIFVRHVMAIAFLPLILVRQNFLLLHQSRTCVNLILQFPPLTDWLEYIHLTYRLPCFHQISGMSTLRQSKHERTTVWKVEFIIYSKYLQWYRKTQYKYNFLILKWNDNF